MKGAETMTIDQVVRHKIHQAIDELPPESLEELAHFLDFLKFKYQAQPPRKVAVLGGLWQHLDFDVSDADVRALRQKVTAQLLRKV